MEALDLQAAEGAERWLLVDLAELEGALHCSLQTLNSIHFLLLTRGRCDVRGDGRHAGAQGILRLKT